MRAGLLKPLLVALLAVGLAPATAMSEEDDDLAAARAELVEAIAEHARAVGPMTGRPELDGDILEAMREVPRHEFLPAEVAPLAYLDLPLPAGNGLRESQPFIVAMMTDLVAPRPDDDLMILGVGGGYHAAVASTLAADVHCLDLDADAAAEAMERLDRLGYANIEARVADPYYGWPDTDKRFDAIIVRLAIDAVPSVLLRQLKPGGRLVAPVGGSDAGQELTLFTKDEDGDVRERRVLPVRFMRLPGGRRI